MTAFLVTAMLTGLPTPDKPLHVWGKPLTVNVTHLDQCKWGHVKACIQHSAQRWDQSYVMLLRKARCESELNPSAWNPTPVGSEHATGLFQFLPSTFASTPYARRRILSARWNALAAGWMHRVGRGNEWACV